MSGGRSRSALEVLLTDLSRLAVSGRRWVAEAQAVRELLLSDSAKRRAVIGAAYAGHASDAPPVIDRVEPRPDGTFDVVLECIALRSGRITDRKTVVVTRDGEAVFVQPPEPAASAAELRELLEADTAARAALFAKTSRGVDAPLDCRVTDIEPAAPGFVVTVEAWDLSDPDPVLVYATQARVGHDGRCLASD